MNQKYQLPADFTEKLMQKIRKSIFSKSVFESMIILFLSIFELFFEIFAKLFPQKKKE